VKARATMVSVLIAALFTATAFPFTPLASTATPFTQVSSRQPKPSPTGSRLETIFAATETNGTLFENVTAVLLKKYYDERFRTQTLPGLISEFTEKAKHAATLYDQRVVTEELLSHIPASHLGLISRASHRQVMWDLEGRTYPMLGFQLIEINSKYYAFTVLEGGPAARAGVLPWDRIVAIDGISPETSSRVDWRSDDAYIGDDRDPPVHYLLASAGDTIRFKIERRRDKFIELSVPVEDYSAFAAARASTRLLKAEDRSFGYLHFWYVHMTGIPELIKDKIEGEFGKCDGLIIDLRGRGGNAFAISKIVDALRADRAGRHRPIIALIDRQSRSAKDVLAYELKSQGIARLVGEPTAGAVIPASFADVGHDSILMFPTFKLPRYTDLLEAKPVAPDVLIQRAGPLSAGDDPILNAGLAEALKLAKSAAK